MWASKNVRREVGGCSDYLRPRGVASIRMPTPLAPIEQRRFAPEW